MPNITHSKDAVGIRLALALKHLRARLREEASIGSTKLSIAQLSILQNLRLNGQTTAASLAATEHVSQQAIAQTIMPMKSAGLVQTKPDPTDGRKTLINITEAGRKLREALIASRNSWLAQAIESTINTEELAALEKAIELLERLADADR